MKSFMKEFKEFALKGNVMDLAVGMMIGAAFGKIVSSLVNDMLMPLIAAIFRIQDFSALKVLLVDKGAEDVNVYLKYGQFIQNIIDSFNPDIIFFPQMYKRLFGNELDCEKNMDRLLAYSPYGLITVAGDFVYNSQFINNSWKVFIATSLHQKFARKHSFINGKNTEVVGDSHAKAFLQFSGEDPWKKH